MYSNCWLRSGCCAGRLFLFGVDARRVVMLAQQTCDRRRARAMPCGLELIHQFTQTAAQPFAFALRITGGFGLDQLEQLALYLRVFFSTGWRPPPGNRTRSAGREASELANSSRPRRIVFGSRPVINATRVSPPDRSATIPARHIAYVVFRPDATSTSSSVDAGFVPAVESLLDTPDIRIDARSDSTSSFHHFTFQVDPAHPNPS